jgi:catechol 2,3-dioxygenase-like lactoylglutathione lyase family enzyme
MKRLHVHVKVPALEPSIAFYSTLFDAAPVRREADYAKWMLDDPRVNFAISTHGGEDAVGLSHLGVQAEDEGELDELAARARTAGDQVLIERAAECCYARSNKAWVTDPAGIRWETFHTFGDITTYGESAAATRVESKSVAAPAARCCG